jgi:hypothetical protein
VEEGRGRATLAGLREENLRKGREENENTRIWYLREITRVPE